MMQVKKNKKKNELSLDFLKLFSLIITSLSLDIYFFQCAAANVCDHSQCNLGSTKKYKNCGLGRTSRP